MARKNHPSRPSELLRGFPLGMLVGLMLLAVGVASVWNTAAEYQHTFEKEYRLLEVRARQREARISGTLRSVDLMLKNLIEDIGESPSFTGARQNAMLREYMRHMPELRNMLIVDAAGRIRAEARETSIGADVSQREYFLHHRSSPDGEAFHITRPFKATSGVTATTLSRVLRDRENKFAGVVVASIESAFFSDALKLQIADEDVQALLLHREGEVLSAAPNQELVGANLHGGMDYAEHIESAQTTTRHRHRPKFSGVERISVFHDLPTAPLTIVFSRDVASVEKEWRSAMISHLLSFAVLAMLSISLLVMSSRRQRFLLDAQRRLSEQEHELRAVIEAEPECVKRLDAEGRLISMNPAGLSMIEATSLEQVLGQPMEPLVLPEHRAAFCALIRQVFEGQAGALSFEITGLKGGRRWVETHAVPLRNASQDIIALLAVSRDITERKQHEAQQDIARRQLEAQLEKIILLQSELKEQAIRDPLTGLYNRRYLNETLPRELSRARRDVQPLAVVMLDLDHFKQVNDTYGHAAGDAVLKAVAVVLETGARESDMVCRYGGEEFLIALPGINAEQALQRAESWRVAMAATAIRHGDAAIVITLSAGIALFPNHGEDVLSLIACADRALYESKNGGRNRVTLNLVP